MKSQSGNEGDKKKKNRQMEFCFDYKTPKKSNNIISFEDIHISKKIECSTRAFETLIAHAKKLPW